MIRSTTLALLIFTISGCEAGSEEANTLGGAVESFIKFGMSNEERAKSSQNEEKLPRLNVRSRKITKNRRGGAWVEIELDVPHHLTGQQVEETLEIEFEQFTKEENLRRIKLIARPAGLVKYGKKMGILQAKQDKNGDFTINVKSLIRDKQSPLTEKQHKALVDYELLLATDPRNARKRIHEQYGKKTLDTAIRTVKKRFANRSSRPQKR